MLFICTANLLDTVPPALRDRMEVINLSGYTNEEKLEIAKRFLIPRQLQEAGISSDLLDISTDAVLRIIEQYTREAGLRNLEREIAAICRKVARKVADGRTARTRITQRNLQQFLGPARFLTETQEQNEIGVATGLAWTSAGGEVLHVEASLSKGRGNLTLTGQLGDVMRESAQAAVSYARAQAKNLGLEENFYQKQDIHIHVPSGSIPKDGPSAGITMGTALISALTRRPVSRNVAMTGEITLRGRVLPVGGLKEKCLAAFRSGVETVTIPFQNQKDLEDIPPSLAEQAALHPGAEHERRARGGLWRQAARRRVSPPAEDQSPGQGQEVEPAEPPQGREGTDGARQRLTGTGSKPAHETSRSGVRAGFEPAPAHTTRQGARKPVAP